jgi:hypothetical protein
MEYNGSLPRSKDSGTWIYLKPAESRPYLLIPYIENPSIFVLPLQIVVRYVIT